MILPTPYVYFQSFLFLFLSLSISPSLLFCLSLSLCSLYLSGYFFLSYFNAFIHSLPPLSLPFSLSFSLFFFFFFFFFCCCLSFCRSYLLSVFPDISFFLFSVFSFISLSHTHTYSLSLFLFAPFSFPLFVDIPFNTLSLSLSFRIFLSFFSFFIHFSFSFSLSFLFSLPIFRSLSPLSLSVYLPFSLSSLLPFFSFTVHSPPLLLVALFFFELFLYHCLPLTFTPRHNLCTYISFRLTFTSLSFEDSPIRLYIFPVSFSIILFYSISLSLFFIIFLPISTRSISPSLSLSLCLHEAQEGR
ncbi:unnamed protein product [Acanthosepion pharaonis]|uniref:Uncharacterized protein n=1 Tax=Acanthosepion pharaonis TaxID=158019 RepID=A0A812EEK6_ACAPH|nr:unnamed protein product [Sepia pharaonis]